MRQPSIRLLLRRYARRLFDAVEKDKRMCAIDAQIFPIIRLIVLSSISRKKGA